MGAGFEGALSQLDCGICEQFSVAAGFPIFFSERFSVARSLVASAKEARI
jgi:hypothetical protein